MDVARVPKSAPPRVFVDLADGRLAAPEIDAIVEMLRVAAMFEPPEWLLEQASAIGRVGVVADPASQTARLAFDSKSQAVLAGARAVAMRSRRLLYESGPAFLDLEVTGVRGRKDLQVCGHVQSRTGERPQEVRFEHAAHQYIFSIDRRGEFEVESMQGGKYAIEVDFGQWIMAVPQITL